MPVIVDYNVFSSLFLLSYRWSAVNIYWHNHTWMMSRYNITSWKTRSSLEVWKQICSRSHILTSQTFVYFLRPSFIVLTKLICKFKDINGLRWTNANYNLDSFTVEWHYMNELCFYSRYMRIALSILIFIRNGAKYNHLI